MAGPWEKYSAPAAAPAEDGPWAKYSQPEAAPQPTEQTLAVRKAEEERGKGTLRQNLAAGLVRGAGSIGATLMWPIDKAEDMIRGDREQTLSTLITGDKPISRNEERRAAMTDALRLAGANPDSTAFTVGKIGGEIAGTAGVGGALANGLARVPGAAAAMPGVINAIRTGGMTTGTAVAPGAMNALTNLGTRAVGGAVTGGLSAGLVDPEQAGMGAAVGGALPVVMRGAGALGNAAGRVIRGPQQAPELTAAIEQARQAGYVIPPTQAKPTLSNRLLEGFSGKITTAQNASARNQTVTNRLAAQTLGLPVDVPITPQALNNVRQQAGQAYGAVEQAGVITPGPAYERALDRIIAPYRTAAQGFPNAQPSPVIDAIESLRSQSFDSSAAVAQLRNVRDMADTAYAQGNRSVGRSLREGAAALEDAIEAHLAQTGNQPILQQFRDARRLIAQSYSVEKALNPTTGTVDARKLAAEVKKAPGRMTGQMRDAAEFAARFPKAAQPVEGMGSLPQTSPLDWAAGGLLSAATANPLAMAGVVARPAARSLALSPLIQNRLAQQANPNALAQLLASNPGLEQLGYQALPVGFASAGR